jgi:hypothetical protein
MDGRSCLRTARRNARAERGEFAVDGRGLRAGGEPGVCIGVDLLARESESRHVAEMGGQVRELVFESRAVAAASVLTADDVEQRGERELAGGRIDEGGRLGGLHLRTEERLCFAALVLAEAGGLRDAAAAVVVARVPDAVYEPQRAGATRPRHSGTSSAASATERSHAERLRWRARAALVSCRASWRVR